MTMKPSPIPDWYAADWTPVQTRGELPAMTWEAVEAVIEHFHPTGPGRDSARRSFRMLWLESSRMTPLDLLQAFLITASETFDPNRLRARSTSSEGVILTTAAGALPRWSYTDIEVVMSHTWRGLALAIGNHRHHDLLMRRGERLSPTEATLSVCLLVAGLPCRNAETPGLSIQTPARARIAA